MRQLWTRAAVIALTAGTLAACESTGGAQYPIRGQAPTPNFPVVQAPVADQQPEGPSTPPDEPAPSFSAPSGNVGVSSQSLAPAQSEPAWRPPAQSAPVAPPPAPAARPVVVTTVGGPVVTIAGPPKTYKVKSGDNIDAIARSLGTTRAQLAKDNDLKSPYRIKPGQVLQGPDSKDAKAYVVQTGDTMFAIAKRFSVSAAALAEENDLSTGSAIRKGQKLRLPDGYKDKGPSKTTVMQAAPASSSPFNAPPIGATPSRAPTTASRPPAPERGVEEDEPEAPSARPVTTTTTSVTGSVVEVAGPRRTYTVKSGDAIDAIARGLDTTRADLVKDNKLKAPYTIHPGQKLKGPETTAKAYVANSGDTLTNIAKRFNVKPAALAEENDLKVSATLKKGQKIRLPSGYKDKGPLKTTVTTTPAAPRPTTPTPSYTPPADTTPAPLPTAPRPYTPPPTTNYPRTPTGPVSAQPVTPPPSSGQIIGSSPPPTEAEITAAGRGRFVWPIQGQTISDFGPKGTGQRNDGVNIRAAAGTPVRAAAAGEVVYAGNQVPGFGNLVLVKHADGWVTAYAHLSTTEVKMRQQVAQGATLGAVGQTGGVTEPQLHFEVRYAPTPKDKARPVDPGLVLPK